MFDDFDLFDHSGNASDSLLDDGQHDDSQCQDEDIHLLTEHETMSSADDSGGYPDENTADLGDLTPSDHELQHLENLEQSSLHPDHHTEHQDISFGSSDTISCSDCSGSCAAYCASLYR